MKRIRSVLLVLVLLVSGAAALFAGGNKEVPQIPPVTSGPQYFSPNGDGIKDEASLSFSVRIYVKSKEGYVPEYGLEIKDEGGEVLRRIVETEKRDIGFFAALFSGYKEFTLERTVTWNGLDESGQPFPDGRYNLSLWVVDANGNRQESDLDDYIIDTVSPSARPVAPGSLLFSPNGDGNLDDITITHVEATEEVEWNAAMVHASGSGVRTWSWEGIPEDISWDGKTDSGAAAPSGTYRYVLSSTDRAGNESGEITIEGIQLSLLDTPLAILPDPPAISPNGDGVKDSTTIYFDRQVTEGVAGWSWAVLDGEGRRIIGGEGEGEPPLEVVYDGTDRNGAVIAEGEYVISHSLLYRNGNNPEVREKLTVDLTPPDVSLTIENPIFSPDGDGRRDQTRARFTADERVFWEGALLSPEGEEVFASDGPMTGSVAGWDGTLPDGSRAPEGSYVVIANFTDEAGNTSWPEPETIKLDLTPVTLTAEASRAFSPNGDGSSDIMPVSFDSNQYDEVESWKLRIVDESGSTLQEYGGSGTLPRHVAWDGTVSAKDDFGAAPEGRYRAVAEVAYLKGAVAESRTDLFLLDTTPPEVNLAVTSSPFAETDEGVEGEVFITVNAADNDGIADWSLELLDEHNDVLRVYDGEGDPSGDITWNQTENVLAPELEASRFFLKLRVADEGGNVTVFSRPLPLDLLLVKKDGRFYLSVPNVIFGAYKHELASAGPEMLARNRQTLDRIAGIYARYPSYDLILEGHALNIYRGTGREAREESILQPLTVRRADTVRNALVERGMESGKIETEAYGGRFPNADVTDESLWWKVRRVEFVMVPPNGLTAE
jgi:flagellar hook assembly protein FlgD